MTKLKDKINVEKVRMYLQEIYHELEPRVRNAFGSLATVQPHLELNEFDLPTMTLKFVPRGAISQPQDIPLTRDQERELGKRAGYIGEIVAQIATDLDLDVDGGADIGIRVCTAPEAYSFKPHYERFMR